MPGTRRPLLATVLLLGACAAGSTSPAPDTTAPVPSLVPSTTATTTVPVLPSGGVLAFGAFGVTVSPFAGDQVTLASDPFYEQVDHLVSDGAGGIVFLHRVTPLAWPQGSVLWLPRGEIAPRLVVSGAPRHQLIPTGVVEVSGARSLLYIDWDMDQRQGSAMLKPLTGGAPVAIWQAAGWSVRDAATGGGRIVLHLVAGPLDSQCRVVLVDPFGVELEAPGLPHCTDYRDPRSFQLSDDGEEVWYLDGRGERLVVQSVSDRDQAIELRIRSPHHLRYDGADTAVVATATGPVVVTRNGDQLDAERIEAVEGASGLVPYAGSIALTPHARLGTGVEEYPCTTRTPLLPEQDLPAAVAATRTAIHEAIVACDWSGLIDIASAGGGIHYSVAYDRGLPVLHWLQLMVSGDDVLGDIATVLTLPPIERIYEDGTVHWIWPAIGGMEEGAGSDADWQALLPLYTQAEIDALRDSPEGYAGGFEVVISGDGTWIGAFTLSV